MLSPRRMVRLRAVVLERDERKVLRELGRIEKVQLTHTPAGEDSAPLPSPDRSTEIARCERLRSRIAELRRSFKIACPKQVPLPSDSAIEEAEIQLVELELRVHELVNCREKCLRRSMELDTVDTQVSRLRGLEVRLDEIQHFEFLHFVTGSLPEGVMLHLDVGDLTAVLPLPARDGRQPLVAVVPKSRQTSLENVLRKAGFRNERPPLAQGATVKEVLAQTEQERAQISAELESVDGKLSSLVNREASKLMELEARVEIERRLLEVEQYFPRTEASVLLTGWISEATEQDVRQCLLECTEGCCVIELSPPGEVPEADIPVLLRHPRLLRPFELLVSAYGLPRYRELAPTIFVAVSFVLMFGMMFGDLGGGVLLTVAGILTLLKTHKPRSSDVGILLIFNGLSSALFGVLYGSCFGIPRFKEHALWHDPLEGNPMDMMVLAIGFGVALMSIGLVLNIVNRFRHQKWADAVLGKFGIMGIMFYWGTMALVLNSAAIRLRGWWTFAVVLFVGIPLLSWILEPLELLQHRRDRHAPESDVVLGAFIESMVGAFEGALLYLANTISFVRLAAYAMSHAALLTATFTLAAEVRRMANGGVILSAMVIIVGNLVAILLEGIVASVQALRLEYYEFFGKFFSGDGRPFKPFCLAVQST
jgi:V/A-type H+/Na+-transporting ATPase subunit I